MRCVAQPCSSFLSLEGKLPLEAHVLVCFSTEQGGSHFEEITSPSQQLVHELGPLINGTKLWQLMVSCWPLMEPVIWGFLVASSSLDGP